MKFYDDHFRCFGCQATGDVIEFTSKLFGITALEAAKKLAADFGIREARPSVMAMVDAIPDEMIRAYTAQKYEHHSRMNQEI